MHGKSKEGKKGNIETNIDLLHVTCNKHDIHNLFINIGMRKNPKQNTTCFLSFMGFGRDHVMAFTKIN